MSTFIALLVFFSLCADGFNLRRQFKLHESSVHSFPPLSDCKECYQKKITKINLLSATPMEKQKDVAEAHEGLVNLKGDSETLSKSVATSTGATCLLSINQYRSYVFIGDFHASARAASHFNSNVLDGPARPRNKPLAPVRVGRHKPLAPVRVDVEEN